MVCVLSTMYPIDELPKIIGNLIKCFNYANSQGNIIIIRTADVNRRRVRMSRSVCYVNSPPRANSTTMIYCRECIRVLDM